MSEPDLELHRQLSRLRELEPSVAELDARLQPRIEKRRRHRRLESITVVIVIVGFGGAGLAVLLQRPSDQPERVSVGQEPRLAPTTSTLGTSSAPVTDPPGVDVAPLVAAPTSGVRDGSLIDVHGQVAPQAVVNVQQCSAASPDDCAVGSPLTAVADDQGRWHGHVVIRRWLGFPGEFVDCVVQGCGLYAMVGSGGGPSSHVPLQMVEDGVPAPMPSMTVSPAGALQDGQLVHITATGLPPGARTLIGVCAVQEDPQGSPPCVYPGGFDLVADESGTVELVDYPVHLSEAAAHVDCSTGAGCEFAWYPAIGRPPYIRHTIQIAS